MLALFESFFSYTRRFFSCFAYASYNSALSSCTWRISSLICSICSARLSASSSCAYSWITSSSGSQNLRSNGAPLQVCVLENRGIPHLAPHAFFVASSYRIHRAHAWFALFALPHGLCVSFLPYLDMSRSCRTSQAPVCRDLSLPVSFPAASCRTTR